MAGNIKKISASVHERLLNMAKRTSRPFNELLQRFAIERFIYRLSKSPHADRFILKGALMLSVWSGPISRPTMDIDLLGKINTSLEEIKAVIRDACKMDVEEDGMFFNEQTVSAARITEDTEYEGVRVRIQGNLGNARVWLQIDIGFGECSWGKQDHGGLWYDRDQSAHHDEPETGREEDRHGRTAITGNAR